MADKPTLFSKLATIMGEMSRLPKTGVNKIQGYKFVQEGDVLDAVREKMAEQNIAFFACIVDKQIIEGTTNKGGTNYHAILDMQFTFACGDTGDTYTCPWVGEAIDTSDKAVNKAATAGEKFFLLKTFLLSTGEDTDADSPSAGQRKQNSRPTPKQAAPKQTTQNQDNIINMEPPANATQKRKDIWEQVKAAYPTYDSFEADLARISDQLTANSSVKQVVDLLTQLPEAK